MKKLCLLFSLVFILVSELPAIELSEEEATRQLLAEEEAYKQYKGYLDEIKIIFALKMKQELNLGWSGDL